MGIIWLVVALVGAAATWLYLRRVTKGVRPVDEQGREVDLAKLRFPPRYWFLISIPMTILALFITATAIVNGSLAAFFPLPLIWGLVAWCAFKAWQSARLRSG
jgi:hypothetical protein